MLKVVFRVCVSPVEPRTMMIGKEEMERDETEKPGGNIHEVKRETGHDTHTHRQRKRKTKIRSSLEHTQMVTNRHEPTFSKWKSTK